METLPERAAEVEPQEQVDGAKKMDMKSLIIGLVVGLILGVFLFWLTMKGIQLYSW